MRLSRLTSRDEWYKQSRSDWGKHVLPYKDLDDGFVADSSNITDIGLTLVKFSEDEKWYYLNYYNKNGIVAKFKKKKQVIKDTVQSLEEHTNE